MTAFPQLSNGDIDNIIAHTSTKSSRPCLAATARCCCTVQDGGAHNIILGALVLVMAYIVMLFLVNNVLKKSC
jgi:hypothetical protein